LLKSKTSFLEKFTIISSSAGFIEGNINLSTSRKPFRNKMRLLECTEHGNPLHKRFMENGGRGVSMPNKLLHHVQVMQCVLPEE
jgi:hypothetical protein